LVLMLAAVLLIAVIAWVIDQTLGDIRQIWRTQRPRR
jgi:hypothetical protein